MRIDNSQTTVTKIPEVSKIAARKNIGRNENTKAEDFITPKSAANEKQQLNERTQEKLNEEQLVKKSNTTLETKYVRFEFNIHEATEKIMVKVIDKNTDEVIREIPPEKILDMVAKMWELAGLFVDEKI